MGWSLGLSFGGVGAVAEPCSATAFTDLIAALGPEGYWKLDETSGATAADSSGNGHHGTYQTGARRAERAGPCEGAYVNAWTTNAAVIVPDHAAWSPPNDLSIVSLVAFQNAVQSNGDIASMTSVLKSGEWANSHLFQGIYAWTQSTGVDVHRQRYDFSMQRFGSPIWNLVVGLIPAGAVFPTVELNGVAFGDTAGPEGTRAGNTNSELRIGVGHGTIAGTPSSTRGRFLAHVAVFTRLLDSTERADLAAARITDGWNVV